MELLPDDLLFDNLTRVPAEDIHQNARQNTFSISVNQALLFHLRLCFQIIKEWNAELQEHTGKLADWDRKVLQNRDILLTLEIWTFCVRNQDMLPASSL